jgi:hypothetical protein
LTSILTNGKQFSSFPYFSSSVVPGNLHEAHNTARELQRVFVTVFRCIHEQGGHGLQSNPRPQRSTGELPGMWKTSNLYTDPTLPHHNSPPLRNTNQFQVTTPSMLSMFHCVRRWAHCIRIWPIFYTDIHGRQRQNKQMRFSKWRRSQWRRAALTCTDMFRRLKVETKSFCFFRPCMPVCRVVSC